MLHLVDYISIEQGMALVKQHLYNFTDRITLR
jgi:hypothetical protein